MNCPKCGLQTLPDQKFCRSCGATLQMITQPLVEPATVSELGRTPAIIFKDEKQRANRLVLWGFIFMFIGAAIGIIGKKLMHDEIVTVIGVMISLAGMFFVVYPYLSPPPPPKVRLQAALTTRSSNTITTSKVSATRQQYRIRIKHY